MAALPFEVLFGIYLGLLTGIVPAVIAGLLGFVFKYMTGVTLPGLGVVALAVAIAGVNGGLLGLIDPSISASPRLVVALVVVMMLSLYAHSQGDQLGATLPQRLSLRSLRERTLSADVISAVGGRGRVTIHPHGEVHDLEGYPPLPSELHARIASSSWTFPADLPLSELERRLRDRLQTAFDLADVTVVIDASGRATIAAAPPSGAISRRIPDGRVAVSIDALVPGGMARGDDVTVRTEHGAVRGTLLSAKYAEDTTSSDSVSSVPASSPSSAPEVGIDRENDHVTTEPVAPTTDGGEGRITVAISSGDESIILSANQGRILVHPRGGDPAFALVAALRRANARVEQIAVRDNGPLDGVTIGAISGLIDGQIAVLGVRSEEPTKNSGNGYLHRTMHRLAMALSSSSKRWGDERANGWRRGSTNVGASKHHTDHAWQFAPDTDRRLVVGDLLYVAGKSDHVSQLAEVIE